MLPLDIFASRQFSAANAVTFVVYGALGGSLFLLPIQLQRVVGYSPLASGVALVPITVVMLLLSARAGRLASRIGPRLPMTLGPAARGRRASPCSPASAREPATWSTSCPRRWSTGSGWS